MSDLAQINIQNLSKKFKGSWLFKHLNDAFLPGDRIAILGLNGSGKSTFLKVVSGYMEATEGSVEWHTEIKNEVVFWHRFYSYCAPYQELIEEFTLQESINFHFKLKNQRAEIDLNLWLTETNLIKHLNKPVARFSSGMKQRLKLILTMASNTPVYFLDEPCSNLDNDGINWFHCRVSELSANSIVFIASNSPKEYETCSRYITMNTNS